MNKLNFWIISDDPNPEAIDLYIDQWRYNEKLVKHVKSHIKYEIVGDHLVNCQNLSGNADVIIMDMSSLTLGNTFNTYGLLKKFLRKHTTGVFHLVCYVINNARVTIEEIEDVFKEEGCILSYGNNGNEAIANYMCDKTLDYYPYKE